MWKLFIKALLILTFCSFLTTIKAGEIPYVRPQNNVQLNLFGDAAIFSISYERLFVSQQKFFLATKFGLGYSQSLGLPVDGTSLFAAPMHVTGNYGGKSHYFEFGFGATLMFYKDFIFWDYAIYPIVGYRFQPKKTGNFSFRIFAAYPLTDQLDSYNYWFSPVGLSLGFCFK